MTRTPEPDKRPHPKPEREPKVDVEMIKDLDVDERDAGQLRGGTVPRGGSWAPADRQD